MPEIQTMLCLSTGHLPQHVRDDMDLIAALGADFSPNEWRSRIMATNWFSYGWIMYVPEDEEQDIPLPIALSDCIAFGRIQRAGFIKFDTDVEPVADLTLYE